MRVLRFPGRSSKRAGCLRLFFLTGILACGLQADIIYDNVNGDAFSEDGAGPGNLTLYDSFTAIDTSQITEMEMYIGGCSAVGLYSDNSSTPGALIAIFGNVSTSGSCSRPDPDNSDSLRQVALVPDGPVLAADTRYWIGLSDPNSDWSWTSINASDEVGVQGEYFSNEFGTFPNGTSYMMLIDTTAVEAAPEPSTASLIIVLVTVLVCSAGLSAGLCRIRKELTGFS